MRSADNITIAMVPPPARRASATGQSSWLFAAWMAGAGLLAAASGMVLGILAALERGPAASRWTEVVQAHGKLQLFGFAGVFIVALTFEFLPRLLGRPFFPALVRATLPAALGAGALIHAAGQLWAVEALIPLGAAITMAAGLAFAVVVIPATLTGRQPTPLPFFFVMAAAWLATATVLGFVAALRADGSVVQLADARITNEVFLRGFVLTIVLTIGFRAFPGHFNLEPLRPRQQAVLLGLVAGGVVAFMAGAGAFGLDEVTGLRIAGDLAIVAVIALMTLWSGIVRVLLPPWRGPVYRVLVPIAWLGLIAYGAALLVGVATGADSGIYEEGAIRHLFLVGFMVPLMIAMAHIVLARFGQGRIPWERLLSAAFVLVVVAAPLRVLPVVVESPPGDAGDAMLGLSGTLVAAGLLLTATVAARTAWLIRTSRQ